MSTGSFMVSPASIYQIDLICKRQRHNDLKLLSYFSVKLTLIFDFSYINLLELYCQDITWFTNNINTTELGHLS